MNELINVFSVDTNEYMAEISEVWNAVDKCDLFSKQAVKQDTGECIGFFGLKTISTALMQWLISGMSVFVLYHKMMMRRKLLTCLEGPEYLGKRTTSVAFSWKTTLRQTSNTSYAFWWNIFGECCFLGTENKFQIDCNRKRLQNWGQKVLKKDSTCYLKNFFSMIRPCIHAFYTGFELVTKNWSTVHIWRLCRSTKKYGPDVQCSPYRPLNEESHVVVWLSVIVRQVLLQCRIYWLKPLRNKQRSTLSASSFWCS